MPPDASELDVSIGTPPARDGAASTAQVGAADEDMAEDSLQGTDLLSMMNEIGEELRSGRSTRTQRRATKRKQQQQRSGGSG